MAARIQPTKFASILVIWSITLLYVLFQGGKTAFMLFIMVSVLIAYLIAGGLGGVRRAKGVRSFYAEQDKGDLLSAGGYLRVGLKVTIPGILPLPYVVVREVLKRHNGESWVFEESLIPSLRGLGELRFQTPVLERGTYTFSDTDIISQDIFALLSIKVLFWLNTSFRCCLVQSMFRAGSYMKENPVFLYHRPLLFNHDVRLPKLTVYATTYMATA